MSHAFKQMGTILALLLVVISLGALWVAGSRDPLLGLWDSGHFSSGVMPNPELIPDEELVKLRVRRHIVFRPAHGQPPGQNPSQNPGDSLAELFKWYDLDARYVDATVSAEHLDPERVPSEPFEVVLINDH